VLEVEQMADVRAKNPTGSVPINFVQLHLYKISLNDELELDQILHSFVLTQFQKRQLYKISKDEFELDQTLQHEDASFSSSLVQFLRLQLRSFWE
jgi:hypothetical protein